MIQTEFCGLVYRHETGKHHQYILLQLCPQKEELR